MRHSRTDIKLSSHTTVLCHFCHQEREYKGPNVKRLFVTPPQIIFKLIHFFFLQNNIFKLLRMEFCFFWYLIKTHKANSYNVVLLAQLSAFLSTRDCQIFCLCTVRKKKNLHLLPRNNF